MPAGRISRWIRAWLLFCSIFCQFSGSVSGDEADDVFGKPPGAAGPNILLILTDDQGWPTLGCYGAKHVHTPHLNWLAAGGARFTNAYVTSQCTPTRATLLTGQYTARHGLWHVLSWYGYPNAKMTEPMFAESFPRTKFTLAKGLRALGYRTAIVGKWHLTSGEDGNYMGLRPSAATHYGFDFAPPILSQDEFQPGHDRGVETLTSQAIEFIKSSQGRPWFCFLSHHMIHGKVVAPEEITKKYRAKGHRDEGPNRAVYLAGLECIDNSVGRLEKALKELNQLDNTLILFLSDNGGIHEKLDFKKVKESAERQPEFPIELREYNNRPLRAGKGSVYEGGVRVPWIAHWPGVIPPGQVIKTPVHAIDILPTCLLLAGDTVPKDYQADGANLLELMTSGTDRRLTNRPLFQYYPFYDLRWGNTPCASVRLGSYKLIEFFGDWVDAKHTYQTGNRIELYNLVNDPGETMNLANAKPVKTKALHNKLRSWMKEVGAEVPRVNPHYEANRAFLETRQKPDWLKNVQWKPRGVDSK